MLYLDRQKEVSEFVLHCLNLSGGVITASNIRRIEKGIKKESD